MSNKDNSIEQPKLTVTEPVVEQVVTSSAAENNASADAAERKPAGEKPEKDPRPLSELLNERATEDESALKGNFRLSNIIAGEMFNTSVLREQIGVIILIAFFIVVNISNRYGCEQRLIKIDRLEKNIQDMKYRTLSNKSRLTQESRQGNVIRKLQESQSSELQIPDRPPYEIYIPEED
jgi:hypothetical protein